MIRHAFPDPDFSIPDPDPGFRGTVVMNMILWRFVISARVFFYICSSISATQSFRVKKAPDP